MSQTSYIRDFSAVLVANGFREPKGIIAKFKFNQKWEEAQAFYDEFVDEYTELTAKWTKVRVDLAADWGYKVPSLVEIEGFLNIRFKTPKQAIMAIKKAEHNISFSDLDGHKSDLIHDFRAKWANEILKTASAKKCNLVVLRAYGKIPELSGVLEFSNAIQEGKEACLTLPGSPIWVACHPEKVNKFLDAFTRETTAVNYI